VFGQAREPDNEVEQYLSAFLADKINRYIEIGVFVGGGTHQIVGQIEKPTLTTSTGYNSMDMQGSRFIQLDMRAKSLRNGSTGQWSWLLQQLNDFNGKNVFIGSASIVGVGLK